MVLLRIARAACAALSALASVPACSGVDSRGADSASDAGGRSGSGGAHTDTSGSGGSAGKGGRGAAPAGSGGRGGGPASAGGSGDTDAGAQTDSGADANVPPSGTLGERYPGDVGIASDPAVLFHDDFEAGWGRWDAPTADTMYLHLEDDAATAHAGSRYLRSTVTAQHLAAQMYISSSTRVTFERRVDAVYFRFYARFPELAPNPHHWVRIAAGDEDFSSSGLANTVPAGDDGFWFDFDADNDDWFNFYVYWYEMRSGRCNDGSAIPGCEGDQGSTYYYGNVFRPPDQQPFPRDRWFCIEIHARANTVGSSDGALAFWIDDAPVGDYRPGTPEGTWLREQFHSGGCEFSACSEPEPFEGFDFRSSDAVGFKSIFLDAYYERESSADKRAELISRGLQLSDAQTILYDDVVVATERIGCAR
jgi:hypothetical protein